MNDVNKANADVSLDNEFSSESVQTIDENARLIFAKQILIGLFIFCVLIFTAYIFMPMSKALQDIFEFFKIGILPLVTLVIAFYFTPTK